MHANPLAGDSEATHEQRRQSQCVENVLCAYLNRHMLPMPADGDEQHSTMPQNERDEHYAALQATMSSRMPRAYQWAPQTSIVPGTSFGDFHPSMVYLCAPFAQCVRAEAGIYFAFERLMAMVGTCSRLHQRSTIV